MSKISIQLILFFLVTLIPSFNLVAQSEKIDSSSNSQVIKNEIKTGLIRPSVVSASGRITIDRMDAGKIHVSDTKNTYTISTKGFTVSFNRKPFAMEFKNNQTRQKWLLESIESGTGSLKIKSIIAIERKDNTWILATDIPALKIIIEPVLDRLVRFSIENSKEQTGSLKLNFKGTGDFYGGGERFMGSKLNGRKFTNQPTDHFWFPWSEKNVKTLQYFEPSYISVPFLLTPQGNGLYVDQAKTVEIDLLQSNEGIFSLNLNGTHTDIYLFACENPKQLLNLYTSIVGRTPLMPEWANGIWVNLLEGKDNVYNKIQELKALNIPVDAIWIFDYDDPKTNTGWAYWSKGYYGNPRELTDSIHKMGYKVLTYLRNYVDKDLFYYRFPNPVYEYCQQNNLILQSEDTPNNKEQASFQVNGQVNFYKKEAKYFWKGILKQLLVDDNFDGWMEDFGDINHYFKKSELKYYPLKFKIDMPMTDDEIANLYPLVYHKTCYELSHELKKDIISFSRSGSAGSGRYCPIVWGGDQYPNWDVNFGYVSAISAGISAGLSGYGVWTPDILSNPSRELWMRWVEFGALSPVMRDHLWENAPNTYKIWTDTATRLHFKKYAQLHTKLIPYLNACAKESHETGTPVIRHLMLEYPADTTTYNLDYQYLLGDEILVAPVLKAGDITQKVYLPEGEWKYYWNNKIYKGKNWITVDAPTEEIPFFIKQEKNSKLLETLKK